MSAFLQSGRFYPGETPIFRVRFRPEADLTRVRLRALRTHSKLQANRRAKELGMYVPRAAIAHESVSAQVVCWKFRGVRPLPLPKK